MNRKTLNQRTDTVLSRDGTTIAFDRRGAGPGTCCPR